jgi:hypothetical protein
MRGPYDSIEIRLLDPVEINQHKSTHTQVHQLLRYDGPNAACTDQTNSKAL